MKRYWVIAPCSSEDPEAFEQAWQYDLKNGTIAIGWWDLGDVSKLNKEELKLKYLQTYEKDSPLDRSIIWKFHNEISIGDIVIVRRGRKQLKGIGEVTSKAYYDLDKGKERKERMGNRDDYSFPNFFWELNGRKR